MVGGVLTVGPAVANLRLAVVTIPSSPHHPSPGFPTTNLSNQSLTSLPITTIHIRLLCSTHPSAHPGSPRPTC